MHQLILSSCLKVKNRLRCGKMSKERSWNLLRLSGGCVALVADSGDNVKQGYTRRLRAPSDRRMQISNKPKLVDYQRLFWIIFDEVDLVWIWYHLKKCASL